jgi:hypothetical protein
MRSAGMKEMTGNPRGQVNRSVKLAHLWADQFIE